MEGGFLIIRVADGAIIVIILKFMLFLHRIFLTLSLSMSKSYINTLILFEHLEFHIHKKGAGG
jgi:hypothetical protein